MSSALFDVIEPMEKALEPETPFRGFCSICDSYQPFKISDPTTEWVNLRNRVICKSCGFGARHRASFQAMCGSTSWQTGNILILEYVTKYFDLVSSRFSDVTGCEYLSDTAVSGEMLEFQGRSVRHENMLDLSFPSDHFNGIYHGDVLEHVPDMLTGLKECHRVLKPGGDLLFTIPFYAERDKTVVRAKIENGQRVDLLPPAYHGNPVSAQGALVFFEPALDFLDDMSSVADWDVQVGLAYSVANGYFSDNHRNRMSRCFNVVFKGTKK